MGLMVAEMYAIDYMILSRRENGIARPKRRNTETKSQGRHISCVPGERATFGILGQVKGTRR